MTALLPGRRDPILFFNRVCSARGERQASRDHRLKWEGRPGGGLGKLAAGDDITWELPRSVRALCCVKAVGVHWPASPWVTLCERIGISFGENSPTDPISVMHKKNDRSNIFVLVSLPFILFDQG